ncbi:MAG TPA: fumarylacetoacetate hydrolase family protein [Solirubrobacteraceae bacterium]|nr:fumarylacetoacetate hydrolase family protein [Solirubrobacteraceae bacterium]
MSDASDPRIEAGMRRQLALLRERVAGGAAPIGWKAGLNAPAPQEKLGLTRPLVGFLTDATLVPSGAEVPIAGWTAPALEPEIAMRLGDDVPGGASRDAVAAAVDALAPAIELVDLHRPADDVEEILGLNIFHRAVVLGAWDEGRAGAGLEGIVLDIDGRVEAADPTAVLGDLTEVVRGVADTLADAGETLGAGQFVICGSVVPAFAPSPGERVVCRFAGLGDVEVRIAG